MSTFETFSRNILVSCSLVKTGTLKVTRPYCNDYPVMKTSMEAYGQLQETKFSLRKFPGNFWESFRLGKLPETDATVTRKVAGD